MHGARARIAARRLTVATVPAALSIFHDELIRLIFDYTVAHIYHVDDQRQRR